MMVTRIRQRRVHLCDHMFWSPTAASTQVKVELITAAAGGAKSGGGGEIGPLSLLFLGLLAAGRFLDCNLIRIILQKRRNIKHPFLVTHTTSHTRIFSPLLY